MTFANRKRLAAWAVGVLAVVAIARFGGKADDGGGDSSAEQLARCHTPFGPGSTDAPGTTDDSCVKLLQTILVNRGAAFNPTGNYGDATTQAVMQFQAVQELPQTGIVDDKTRYALTIVPDEGDWDLRYDCVTLARSSRGGPSSHGPCVVELVARLREYGYRLKDSETFDEATDAAVRDFQLRAGVKAGSSGTVGQSTREALYDELPEPNTPTFVPGPGCTPTSCTLYLSRRTTQSVVDLLPHSQDFRNLAAQLLTYLGCRLIRSVPAVAVACEVISDFIVNKVLGALQDADRMKGCLVVTVGYPPNAHDQILPLDIGVTNGKLCT